MHQPNGHLKGILANEKITVSPQVRLRYWRNVCAYLCLCVPMCRASQHIMTDLGKLLSSSAGLWLQRARTHAHALTLKVPHLPLSLAVEILSAVCTSHTFCSSRASSFIGCGGGGLRCVCMHVYVKGEGGHRKKHLLVAGGWFAPAAFATHMKGSTDR